MKHLAAYLLLGLGGNASPSAADVKAVLSAVGIEADDERLDKLISELKGKDVSEVRPFWAANGKRMARKSNTNDSSSPLAPRSWPPSRLAVLVVPPLPAALLLPAALPRRRLRRRRRRRRSLTRIWASVCSTKLFLAWKTLSYSEKHRAGCASALSCLWRGGVDCPRTWLLSDIPAGAVSIVLGNDNSSFLEQESLWLEL